MTHIYGELLYKALMINDLLKISFKDFVKTNRKLK